MNRTEVSTAFVEYARAKLIDDYLPKIHRCLGELTEDEVWWRPNPACNSVGNLLLHLCGNVRQWIIHGIGGAEDKRQRRTEFDEKGPISKNDLMKRLDDTLNEVGQVLNQFDRTSLLLPRTVQGFDETYLSILFHVVEHFSFHLGQITYITKMKKEVDLKFFDLGEDGYRKR